MPSTDKKMGACPQSREDHKMQFERLSSNIYHPMTIIYIEITCFASLAPSCVRKVQCIGDEQAEKHKFLLILHVVLKIETSNTWQHFMDH